MKNNFNRVAPFYDWLAKIIFGNAIKEAQLINLKYIKANNQVLIIGGGTGWILEEISKLKLPVSITYVDSSSKMIEYSKARKISPQLDIKFICGNENDIPTKEFDVIITNFFLDVFQEDNMIRVISILKNKLKNPGLWLFTDFYRSKSLSQKILLNIMFIFFKTTSNLESSSLYDFDAYFKKEGLKCKTSSYFYNGMIRSGIYY